MFSCAKACLAITLLMVLSGPVIRGQSAGDAEREIVRQVDAAWAEAFRTCNLPAMDKVLHEDLVFVVQSGIVHHKKDQMASVARCDMKDMRVEATRILVIGNAAAVHGTMIYRLDGARANQGTLLYSRVYVKEGPAWRMVQHQSTIQAAPR
jgi:ketosteroid isomerase-like protein